MLSNNISDLMEDRFQDIYQWCCSQGLVGNELFINLDETETTDTINWLVSNKYCNCNSFKDLIFIKYGIVLHTVFYFKQDGKIKFPKKYPYKGKLEMNIEEFSKIMENREFLK